ncbi:MAG: hypothetical protein K0Q55_2292 [Verrucomicrobia bacterium]|jgi:hypothetical protein|nr:hypothetical protein [Verrucomicrobiota bacterium]
MNARASIYLFVLSLIVNFTPPASGATNEWTKTTSGNWEESFWSLGVAPSFEQELVAFRNSGFKALAINASTTADTNSLYLNYLTVDAPAGSSNLLLLNYSGLSVPLVVSSDFIVGTNGALTSFSSALRGGTFYVNGPATFSENSHVMFNSIRTGTEAPAALNLQNSFLSVGLFVVGQNNGGTVVQIGGTNETANLQMKGATTYGLTNGTFLSSLVELQFQASGPGLARFVQASGDAEIGNLRVGEQFFVAANARGEYLLQAGNFHGTTISFVEGSFLQSGGTNITTFIDLPWLSGTADYQLSGGLLISETLSLGSVFPSGHGHFIQSGGVHTNSTMFFEGKLRSDGVSVFGNYTLNGGLLVCGTNDLRGGGFTQSGGTNHTTALTIDEGGGYMLNGGELVSSNTSIHTIGCAEASFIHNNGNHRILNRLWLENFVGYELRGGTLTVTNIEVGPGARFFLTGGSLSNAGIFTLNSGMLRASGTTQQLGQLQVLGEPVFSCASPQATGPTLDLNYHGVAASTTLRFLNSSAVPWSGSGLSILRWSGSTNGGGPHHVYVGTDSQGLTATQLSQIKFVNPTGWPTGSYPARILSTGEVVPAALAPIEFTTNHDADALVLSWMGDYQLLSSTNAAGPYVEVSGATPPFTNEFIDPQRFFLLSEPAP